MNIKISTTYSEEDFNAEDMKGFENTIMRLKAEEKTTGISFIFRGVLFSLDSILYDFDNDSKIFHVQQLSRLKRLVEPVKGIYRN